jgi:hypothetical protein
MDAASLGGGGLQHGVEQECCRCETFTRSIEDRGLGGISVFLDATLDIARLRPHASIEGFASNRPLPSLSQLLQAFLLIPKLVV